MRKNSTLIINSRTYDIVRNELSRIRIGYFKEMSIEKQKEISEKISRNKKEYYKNLSEDRRKQISIAISIGHSGKKLSEEHKRKIGLKSKGRKMPISQRLKTSKRMKKQVESLKRKVLCITTGKIYNSVIEAEQDTHACVARVCMGKYHSSKGLQFRYLDDELNKKYTPKKLKDKSEWKHPQRKAVYCVELDLSFKSLKDCSFEINKRGYKTSRGGPIIGNYIRNVANGKLESCGGLHFKWINKV